MKTKAKPEPMPEPADLIANPTDATPRPKPREWHKEHKPPAALPSGCESLLSRDQIATALGISTRTLDAMLSAGDYPRSDIRIGSLPRWLVKTHNDWLEKRCTKKKGA